MSEQNYRHGKREAAARESTWRQRYRNWLEAMTRGQRIRYRLLQAATVISVLIIVGFLALRAWIRMPDQPDGGLGPGVLVDASGNPIFEGADIPGVASSGRKKGVYTFLVAGKDVVSGSTDTMLLVTYDTEAKTLHGLNLPRDTMVNVSTRSKRLNAVFSSNRGKDKATQVEKGMTALKKEVANLTGITPDYYVLVEWKAVGELVDALNGVEFEVPFDMDYDDPTPGQDLHIHQKAGLRVLSGDDAMQVIRHRKNNDGSHSKGDVGRLKIQQDFLKAVAKKCLQPATFLKIPALAEIFMENVKTDLTVGNIIALAQQAKGMDPDNGVSFVTAPLAANFRYGGADMVTLNGKELIQLINDKLNPYLKDVQYSDLRILYRNSDGSFGVSSGALADEKMGQKPAATSKPEQKPAVVDPPAPDGSQTGGGTGTDDQPADGNVTDPAEDTQPPKGGGSDPDVTDQPGPDQNGGTGEAGGGSTVPEQGGAQDITSGGEEITATLPPRPQPVEQAA